jgi:hypothetical protein
MSEHSEILRAMAAVCKRGAGGDLEARIAPIPGGTEYAELARAINDLLDVSDAFVREATAATEHCSRGEYHRPILLRGFRGSYRNAAKAINRAACMSTAPAARRSD